MNIEKLLKKIILKFLAKGLKDFEIKFSGNIDVVIKKKNQNEILDEYTIPINANIEINKKES